VRGQQEETRHRDDDERQGDTCGDDPAWDPPRAGLRR